MTDLRSTTRPGAAASSTVEDDYTRLCDVVRGVTGIDLGQYKRRQMERRIRSFAQRRGTPSLDDYAKVLKADPLELEDFLDKVTINVSQLWRNPDQWERLEKQVIPELAAQGSLKCWSAGSSYGAEAYTLAALAHHVAGAKLGSKITITGTDIDKRMVARAKTGTFTADDARDANKSLLSRFFDADGKGGWNAKPEIKRLVRFEVGDLLRLRVKPAAYDLVLCRNTVIYFNDEVRDALHARLAASLRSGGCLVVGATERVADPAGLGLASTHPFTYRKS